MKLNRPIESIQDFLQKKDYESSLKIIFSTLRFMDSDIQYRDHVQSPFEGSVS